MGYYDNERFPDGEAATVPTNVIPASLLGNPNGPTLAQLMQTNNINPSVMAGLLHTAYASPPMEGIQDVNKRSGPNWSTQQQNQAYIDHAKNGFGFTPAQNAANQAGWNSMYMGSPVFNPNGSNTGAIQSINNTAAPAPIFNPVPGEARINGGEKQITNPLQNNGGVNTKSMSVGGGLTGTGTPQYSTPFLAQLGSGNGLREANSNNQQASGNVGPTSTGGVQWNKALWR